MSNFFVLVHDTASTEPVDRWLGRFASTDDIHLELRHGSRIVVISKQVRRSVSGTQFFRGSAVDMTAEAIVFGISGWLKAPAKVRERAGDLEGEHVVIDWSGEVTIDRDVFGSCWILHTAGTGFAAASDSLLALASLRHALGVPNTESEEVLIARTALNEVASQQISDETLIQEIRFVPAGQGLVLTNGAWVRTHPVMTRRLAQPVPEYVEGMRAAALNVARILRTISAVEDWDVSLALSGGYDSRVLLAAALAAGVADSLVFESVNHGERFEADFRVANDLAKRYGLRTAGARGRFWKHDELSRWGALLFGVSDDLGAVHTGFRRTETFELTGIGAEAFKGVWDWRPISDLAAYAAPPGDVHDALLVQLQKALSVLGSDDYDRSDGSELYYVGFRNGIHGSADHVAWHLAGLRPLQQMSLAAQGHKATIQYSVASRALGMTDLSLLLDAEAAIQEYDDPGRNVTEGYARARLEHLGGRIDRRAVRPLEVFGSPEEVPAGASSLSVEIARALGLSGSVESEQLLDFSEAALDLFPENLRPYFASNLANGRWRVETRGDRIEALGMSPFRPLLGYLFELVGR